MDVNAVNPILDAFTNIFSQFGFQSVERKNLSLILSTINNNGIMVNIGVVGTLKGNILIRMDVESAKKIASTMMGGMDVPELNEMAQSAISELGNMVCANACTKFTELGDFDLNISPPALIMGNEEQSIRLTAPKSILVNYVADGIAVDLCIGLV